MSPNFAQERADRIKARREAEAAALADLAGLRAIARELGVTSNRVYMWHQRRATTGFPSAVASTHRPQHPGDKRKAPLFDRAAVRAWWATYDPNANRGSHWAAKREGVAS